MNLNELRMAGMFRLGLPLIGLFVSLWALAAQAGEFELSITPLKNAYILGEPIGVAVRLKNGTSKDVEVVDEYPYGGFALTRTQINGKDFPRGPDPQWQRDDRVPNTIVGPSAPMKTLSPGSEFHGTIYLNELFPFTRSDTYRMKLVGRYFWFGTIESIESACTFEIQIVPEEFTERDLGPILEKWRADNEQVASEVIGSLSCVRQEFVCKYLVKFGRESPARGIQVVQALRKFAGTEEGNKSLEAMGAVFPEDETFLIHGFRSTKEGAWAWCILERVLLVFASKKAMPSDTFLRDQLAARSSGRKWAVLYFLEDHGLPGKVPIDAIEPLTHDESKELAKLAKKVVDKFAKKEPGKEKD